MKSDNIAANSRLGWLEELDDFSHCEDSGAMRTPSAQCPVNNPKFLPINPSPSLTTTSTHTPAIKNWPQGLVHCFLTQSSHEESRGTLPLSLNILGFSTNIVPVAIKSYINSKASGPNCKLKSDDEGG